ncbi:hypothetical protein [Rhodococcus sp. NPDC006774]|uniref:hypothetical protein n=1 Tax=Rhodococcus sp. NPDC006774 TaxID=3157186 RepID=UPI0033E0FEE1
MAYGLGLRDVSAQEVDPLVPDPESLFARLLLALGAPVGFVVMVLTVIAVYAYADFARAAYRHGLASWDWVESVLRVSRAKFSVLLSLFALAQAYIAVFWITLSRMPEVSSAAYDSLGVSEWFDSLWSIGVASIVQPETWTGWTRWTVFILALVIVLGNLAILVDSFEMIAGLIGVVLFLSALAFALVAALAWFIAVVGFFTVDGGDAVRFKELQIYVVAATALSLYPLCVVLLVKVGGLIDDLKVSSRV